MGSNGTTFSHYTYPATNKDRLLVCSVEFIVNPVDVDVKELIAITRLHFPMAYYRVSVTSS